MSGNIANQPMVNLCGGKGKTMGINGKTMCRLTTRAYNLPSKFVLHTVGPIVTRASTPTEDQSNQLAACYTNCLTLAAQADVRSVALCGISTGVFGYPAEMAAHVALRAVAEWMGNNPDTLDHVVFNTFGDAATDIYQAETKNWRVNEFHR